MNQFMAEEKQVVIITGACGRIGSALSARLGKKYRIVGFELLKAIYASENEELVPVDISSDESIHQAFTHIRNFYGNRIASVIHLAAYYSFDQKESPLYDKITVGGTRRLLEALQDFEVEQFIFSSTMLVHRPCKPGEKINEASPVVPTWGYPKSKVATEKLIEEKRGKTPALILRIAGVYDDECHSIPISHQIQRIYEKQFESHFFAGDITHGASFLHMEDLVDAIERAVDQRKSLPEHLVLEVGEEKTLSYDALQRRISSLLFGKEMKTFSLPKPLAKIGAFFQNIIPFIGPSFIKPWMIDIADDHYELDCSLAKKWLGWNLKHSLDQTLPKMIEGLKQDPTRWYRNNQLKK
jgi:nucleoside-diphosphate-sugar epimerase